MGAPSILARVIFFCALTKMTDGSCTDVLRCLEDVRFQKQLATHLQKQPGVSDFESYNVCRIHVHARSFDWTQPPNRNKGGSGTGTGFMLNSFPIVNNRVFIVTAHHVIAHSVQIRVNFAKLQSEYIDAILIGSNGDMDVALLAVDDAAFADIVRGVEKPGLTMGESDDIRPPATVTAHGFALGKPHMQTTKGVVSGRIDGPSRLQTDVAVNPGNSGGPLLNENNEVIGLVTSGMVDAQGINYVAPIHEVHVILTRILKKYEGEPVPDRLPSLNCSFTKANRVLLGQIENCESGVFCTSVHPTLEYPQSAEDAIRQIDRKEGMESLRDALASRPTLHSTMTRERWDHYIRNECGIAQTNDMLEALRYEMLREGDIVSRMHIRSEAYDIDVQMTTKFAFWQDNLGFTAILDRLNGEGDIEGDAVEIDFFRGRSAMQTIQIPLRPQCNVFRKMHADVEQIEYIVIAGIFVMPLMHNHIPLFKREPMHTLMNRPDSRHMSLLVVTHILPESPFNECETIGAGDVLVAINNRETVTLQDCVFAWNEETRLGASNVVTLRMRDGSLATASNSQILEATDRILNEYKSSEYVGYHVIGGPLTEAAPSVASSLSTAGKLSAPPSAASIRPPSLASAPPSLASMSSAPSIRPPVLASAPPSVASIATSSMPYSPVSPPPQSGTESDNPLISALIDHSFETPSFRVANRMPSTTPSITREVHADPADNRDDKVSNEQIDPNHNHRRDDPDDRDEIDDRDDHDDDHHRYESSSENESDVQILQSSDSEDDRSSNSSLSSSSDMSSNLSLPSDPPKISPKQGAARLLSIRRQ